MSNSEFDLSSVTAYRLRRRQGRYTATNGVDLLRDETWEVGPDTWNWGEEGESLTDYLDSASIPCVPCEELPPSCEFMRGQEVGDTVLISHDSCTVGDYGGSGSVGEANIRWLESEVPGCHVDHGAYSSRQAFIPDTESNRGLLDGLNNYPLFDEQINGEVEMEWEEEAWGSWLRSDLRRLLPDVLREWAEDETEDGVNSRLWETYRKAMEDSNNYLIPEDNGICVHFTDGFRSEWEQGIAELAMGDGAWILERLKDIPDCPVRETDDTRLGIALDWCEETGYSDMFIEFLRGWFARDDQNASK